MAAETIAFFLLGGDRDDWVSLFISPRLQWAWLRATLRGTRAQKSRQGS